jgi:hypothetical protein
VVEGRLRLGFSAFFGTEDPPLCILRSKKALTMSFLLAERGPRNGSFVRFLRSRRASKATKVWTMASGGDS